MLKLPMIRFYILIFFLSLTIYGANSFETSKSYLNLLKEKEILKLYESNIKEYENEIKAKYQVNDSKNIKDSEYKLLKTKLDLSKVEYHRQKEFLKQLVVEYEKLSASKVYIEDIIYSEHILDISKELQESIRSSKPYKDYLRLKNKLDTLKKYLDSNKDSHDVYTRAKKMFINTKYDLEISKLALAESFSTSKGFNLIKKSDLSIKLPSIVQNDKKTEKKADKQKNNTEYCYIVNATKLHIRKRMSTKSKIIGQYIKNDTLCSMTIAKNWVYSEGGWVYKKYLKELSHNN